MSTDEHMPRDEFYDRAIQPGFSDTMDFVITRDDDLGLSAEAFAQAGHQMHDFAVARAVGFNRRTGALPNGMRLRLTVEYEAPAPSDLENGPIPWWSYDDVNAPLDADGNARQAALRALLDFDLNPKEDS